jgi:hypothetical protein
MITLIVECTIRNDYTGWITLRFLIFLLLRADHDQRQLASWLPNFIFFYNLLSICRHILVSLVITWFGTLHVVDFVSRVVSIGIDGRILFFLLLVNDPSACHDIEASLSFGNDFSVLMLLKADIFFFEVLLCRFIAFIDWLGVYIVIESFGGEQFGDIFFGPFHHVDLGTSIEFSSCISLFCSLSLIWNGIVDIGHLFFTIMVYSFWLLLSWLCSTCQFPLISHVVVRR